MLPKNNELMENNKLKDFEIEELEFMIPQIEKMYNFEFEKDETYTVNNFEELCELIIEKINLKNVDSCTSQQAFYKLRNSLIETKLIEKETPAWFLKPETNSSNHQAVGDGVSASMSGALSNARTAAFEGLCQSAGSVVRSQSKQFRQDTAQSSQQVNITATRNFRSRPRLWRRFRFKSLT